jgi:beta-glucosidase
MIRSAASFGVLLLAGTACISAPAMAQSNDPSPVVAQADKLAGDLVGKLTIDEKIDQLAQHRAGDPAAPGSRL